MKNVELYGWVRYAVQIEGLSERAAARRFGIDPRTVSKMMKFSVPPGYVRKKAPTKPKLDPFIPVIDGILRDDKSRPKKQQHTSKRIFERLRDEHGFTGGITIVKDYVAGWRQRTQEMFIPLVHPPGHAQADFGEAIGIIGGVERKIHFFAFDLPHSDACFVVGYPAETTEAFCDGHVRAFAFFGGVPKSILYDNTKIAVARILGDGKRQRTRVFTELQSHYLFEDRFGRPGKGSDKGKVEGLVGYARRNFLVPIPVFESFEALNALLLPAGDEHMRASLQIGFTASDKVDDFGVTRDDNGLLAILVFDLQRVPFDFLHLLRDGSIGHGAIRHQVPRIVSFTGTAQRLFKNVNFNRLLSPIRLRHCGDADEGVALDVRHRALSDRDDRSAILERDVGFLAALGRNCQVVTVHFLKRTAHSAGRVLRKRAECSGNGSCCYHENE